MIPEISVYCNPAAARELLIEKGFSGAIVVRQLLKKYCPNKLQKIGFSGPDEVKKLIIEKTGKKVLISFELKGNKENEPKNI